MLEIKDYFCPQESCKSYGLRNHGNLIKAGTYKKKGTIKQMFKCKICGTRFSETQTPLFTSDELVHYETVLRENFSVCEPQEKTGKRGRPRKDKKTIDPELDYAVVHKTREKGRVVNVETKIVFGEGERIQQKLSKSPSNKINTAYVERSNGTLRKMNSHLRRRKSLTFAKDKDYLKAKLNLIIFFYNFIRPHATLSKNADKTRTPRTPALYAGIIDKNWDVEHAFIKSYAKQ